METIAEIVGFLVILGVPLWIWSQHRELKQAERTAAANRVADEKQLAWLKEHEPALYPVRLAEARERWKDDVSKVLIMNRERQRARSASEDFKNSF